ncbi:hypothetical protein LOTGIDRAFT_167063 [Lottia gigantea]|uniref:Rhodanese domain-containing protein n=1 Tax=Lottia gigantea TaxID=225164 RepID=V3ZVC5_LOTGI|nr:hypothetical protein LOTGIDRAFT_167063 [Lottia gigantea]ESO86540.1 hypothetical protein LOTGIDRAFT_167063 [Lottia gigantea]
MSVDNQDFVMKALERMEECALGLIGDASSTHSLPTMSGKHTDLPTIDSSTMSSLFNSSSNFTIIDCRYPYEYQGGHIQGAIKIYTEQGIQTFMESRLHSTKNDILIFHCEFSSHKGPKLRRIQSILSTQQEKRLRLRRHKMMQNIYKLLGLFEEAIYPDTLPIISTTNIIFPPSRIGFDVIKRDVMFLDEIKDFFIVISNRYD